MPVFNFFHWTKEHGYTLTETGPLVTVEINVPAAMKKYLLEKGLPVPQPKSGFALIDTGAFATAVDESIFTEMGIQHRCSEDQHSARRGHVECLSGNNYLSGLDVNELPMERILGCNLKWKTAADQEIIMLLGRDLLRHFLLIYNGPHSDVTLCL